MKIQWLTVLGLTVGLVAGLPAQAPNLPEAEKSAIVQTALDYGDGFYSGDAERMERAIHPDLNKVWVQPLPQAGSSMIGYTTFSMLVELTRAKAGFSEPEARKIKADALAAEGDVACAKVTSAQFNDYLQMLKIDGKWKIVNVLWTPGPDSPRRLPLTGFDPAKESEPVKRVVGSFLEGILGGNAAKMEGALHPEVSAAIVRVMPQTSRTMVVRNRLSGLVEPIRAKMRTFPEDQRKFEITVLDIMDGMAFVETTSALGRAYFQMVRPNDEWKILNILVKPDPNAPQPRRP